MENEQKIKTGANSRIKKVMTIISEIGLRTIYFNFKYLPFRQAVRLPIFLSRKVRLSEMKGQIEIAAPIRTGMIKIGFSGVGIFDFNYSRSIWQVSGQVFFQGSAHIGHGSKISVGPAGVLVFGDNFTITAESSIVATKEVIFGRDCLLSWDVLVMDTDFHILRDSDDTVVNEPRAIKIGNHVWLGCRALILKGSVLPDNSVIAANALVAKPLMGEAKIFAGQPAMELKNGISWEI